MRIWLEPAPGRPRAVAIAPSRSVTANDSSDSSSGVVIVDRRRHAGGGSLRGRGSPGDDRAPRLRLLDHDLAALHQLQHREERDRHDDPVAHAAEQVLEHDHAAPRASAAPDDRRALRRA